MRGRNTSKQPWPIPSAHVHSPEEKKEYQLECQKRRKAREARHQQLYEMELKWNRQQENKRLKPTTCESQTEIMAIPNDTRNSKLPLVLSNNSDHQQSSTSTYTQNLFSDDDAIEIDVEEQDILYICTN